MEDVLSARRKRYEHRYALKTKEADLNSPAARVAELLDMEARQVWQPGKSRIQVKARSLLCYRTVRELGESMTALSRRFSISTASGKQGGSQGMDGCRTKWL